MITTTLEARGTGRSTPLTDRTATDAVGTEKLSVWYKGRGNDFMNNPFMPFVEPQNHERSTWTSSDAEISPFPLHPKLGSL
jgi:hypothetical protein